MFCILLPMPSPAVAINEELKMPPELMVMLANEGDGVMDTTYNILYYNNLSVIVSTDRSVYMLFASGSSP